MREDQISDDGASPETPPTGIVYVDFLFGMISRFPSAKEAGEEHGHRWCHLWCDPGNEKALHVLAVRIGMKRRWFQDRDGFPHYDLLPTHRDAALREGAVETRLKEWVIRTRGPIKGRKR